MSTFATAMRSLRIALLSLVSVVVAPPAASGQGPARRGLPGRSAPDLILLGGRIFTADARQPWAEALAIRGDRIVAVGPNADVVRLAGPRTRRIPLGGRLVVPGFNDAHDHLGAPLPGVAFRTSDAPVPDPPLAQVLDSLTLLVGRTPRGTWLRTDVDATILDDPRARRAALDSVAPVHPVWLAAGTGHGVIVNSAALRALQLDSMLVEGHVARGFVALFLERDYATAERSFDQALVLDPRYAPAHQFHAWYLISAGSVEPAVDEMRNAVQLDPFSFVINARLATMLYYARRFDAALDQAQHTLDLDSTFFHGWAEKARALVALGRCAEALAIIEKHPPQLAAPFRGQRGSAFARCGQRDKAMAEVERLRAEAASGQYVTHYAFASIYAALGNKDQALNELELAVDERAWTLYTLPLEPDFDPFRSDPRFLRLLDRIGVKP